MMSNTWRDCVSEKKCDGAERHALLLPRSRVGERMIVRAARPTLYAQYSNDMGVETSEPRVIQVQEIFLTFF